MSFWKGWLYPLLTTGEFNMCNCTPPQEAPQPFRRGRRGSPERPAHGPGQDHTRSANRPAQGLAHSPAPGPFGHKKIALDPAESSAIG